LTPDFNPPPPKGPFRGFLAIFGDFALQKPELIFKLRRSQKVVRVSKNAKFDEFLEKNCPDGQNSFFEKLEPKTCFSIFRPGFFWQKSWMRFVQKNVS